MTIEKMILTAGPSITKKEINYVTDAVTYGWNDNWNSYLNRFQDAFSKYLILQLKGLKLGWILLFNNGKTDCYFWSLIVMEK